MQMPAPQHSILVGLRGQWTEKVKPFNSKSASFVSVVCLGGLACHGQYFFITLFMPNFFRDNFPQHFLCTGCRESENLSCIQNW